MNKRVARSLGITVIAGVLFGSQHAEASGYPLINLVTDDGSGTMTASGGNFTPGGSVHVYVYNINTDQLVADQYVTASNGWLTGFIQAQFYVGCTLHANVFAFDEVTYTWSQPKAFQNSCG